MSTSCTTAMVLCLSCLSVALKDGQREIAAGFLLARIIPARLVHLSGSRPSQHLIHCRDQLLYVADRHLHFFRLFLAQGQLYHTFDPASTNLYRHPEIDSIDTVLPFEVRGTRQNLF